MIGLSITMILLSVAIIVLIAIILFILLLIFKYINIYIILILIFLFLNMKYINNFQKEIKLNKVITHLHTSLITYNTKISPVYKNFYYIIKINTKIYNKIIDKFNYKLFKFIDILK